MKTLVRRGFEELWNRANPDLAEELFASEYMLHTVGGSKVEGIEAYKQFFNQYHTAFPDLRFTLDAQLAEGNTVVTRWSSTGTHKGELLGVPATGRRVRSAGITWSHIADGKVVEEWTYWDAVGVLQQIGGLPVPSQREEYGWGAASKITGNPGDPAANRAAFQRLMDAWNQHNPEIFDEVFHPEVVEHIPQPRFGSETSKDGMRYHIQAFPDLSIAYHEVIMEGDLIANLWTAKGTHLGEGYGEPTGKKTAFGGINICRFVGGKIVETWWAADWLGLMQQIGAFPPSTDR